jgi:hypothetical protein
VERDRMVHQHHRDRHDAGDAVGDGAGALRRTARIQAGCPASSQDDGGSRGLQAPEYSVLMEGL